MNDINIFVFICFDIFFVFPSDSDLVYFFILFACTSVSTHVQWIWKDGRTQRGDRILKSVLIICRIFKSLTLLCKYIQPVSSITFLYLKSLMCSLLSAWGYTCSAAFLKQTRDTTRVWQYQRRLFSHETQKMTRLFLTEKRRISTFDKSKLTQIHTSNSTKVKT